MKFDLLKNDSISVTIGRGNSIKLYRIISLRDIDNPVCGKISKYSIGGYVEKVANLNQEDESWIRGTSRVLGSSYITGDSLVDLDATVRDSYLTEKSHVSGRSTVQDLARLENVHLMGSTLVAGNVVVKATSLEHNATIVNLDKRILLTVEDCSLTHISYIKTSGRISNCNLTDGAGIVGSDMKVLNSNISGLAILRESGDKLTLAYDGNLAVTTGI